MSQKEKKDGVETSNEKNKWQTIAEANQERSPHEQLDGQKPSTLDQQTEAFNVADEEHLLSNLYDETNRPSIDERLEKQFTDRIHVLEKELKASQDKILRSQAEWGNIRRRLERDVVNAHKYGVEKLVSELLPVMDSLMRALEGASDERAPVKTISHGIELTVDMLSKILEKHGVAMITPQIGDMFDPTQHEAMSAQAVPNTKSNTILRVLQKGYILHGRVVRAAMVIVAS